MLLSFYMALTGSAVMLVVRYKNMALSLGALALLVWAVTRWRNKWRWHSTPLDGLALLWLAVIAVSTLANFEMWRRSAISIWYVGMYLGVWLVLWDCVANRALSRSALVDAMILGSLAPLVFALREAVLNYCSLVDGFTLLTLPPLSSTLGNPNFLAAYLVIVIPLSAARWLTVQRRWQRLALSAYLVVALSILFLTYSRGHWLSIIAAGVVFTVLLLAHYKLLGWRTLRTVWRSRSMRIRMLAGVASLVIIALIGMFLILRVRSFGDAGRTRLYSVAWQVFQEQPLTGSGLFTFGRHLARLGSVPPSWLESHAHSAFFNIAAELGLIGLSALVVSLIVLAVQLRKQWQTLQGAQRLLMIGAAASLSAVAVSHLTDFAVSMVTIALMALSALLVAIFPAQPTRLSGGRARLNSIAALGLWIALYASGLWSNAANSEYSAALRASILDEDWQASLPHFERAIALDPQLSLYHLLHGHVLGVAAAKGEIAPQAAIAAYETFTRQEPNYAPAWANLAALYWQAGAHKSALSAMRRAADLAPKSWLFHYALGKYYEQLGDQDAARRAFSAALAAQPSAALYPVWRETPLRRTLAESVVIPPSTDAVVRALRDGDLQTAESLWQRVRGSERAALLFLIDAILALEHGEKAQAERACQQVERIPPDATARESWRWLCRAYLSHSSGNSAAYREARRALAEYQQLPFDSPIDLLNLTIGYSLFQRINPSQSFLPQVYNPPLPASYYGLLDHLETFVARR
jgi:putative inorganic carbon (HCO3(-)) transporter